MDALRELEEFEIKGQKLWDEQAWWREAQADMGHVAVVTPEPPYLRLLFHYPDRSVLERMQPLMGGTLGEQGLELTGKEAHDFFHAMADLENHPDCEQCKMYHLLGCVASTPPGPTGVKKRRELKKQLAKYDVAGRSKGRQTFIWGKGYAE
jgi:hypothetical protein